MRVGAAASGVEVGTMAADWPGLGGGGEHPRPTAVPASLGSKGPAPHPPRRNAAVLAQLSQDEHRIQ